VKLNIVRSMVTWMNGLSLLAGTLRKPFMDSDKNP